MLSCGQMNTDSNKMEDELFGYGMQKLQRVKGILDLVW